MQQQEALTNTINLTDDGLSLVSRMVHCLYYGSYDPFDAVIDSEIWKSAHQLHAAMYALGDKYDLTLLKETALADFNKRGADHSPLGLLESIPIVYSSTPDSDRRLRGE